MKILQIIPGSGDSFYCENCLRDKAIIKALRAAGHDATVIPLYLPINADEVDLAPDRRVFFGGVNVYLQQKFRFFRHCPRWVDKIFDSKPMLKIAASFAGMTSASSLAQTTISMLRGPGGRQKKEVDRLMEHLASCDRPDVVCLSNALLLGLAETIKLRLKVPIVCFLQDEDEFVGAMDADDSRRIWSMMAERARHVDVFVAPSRFYQEFMRDRLAVHAGKIRMVRSGIDMTGRLRSRCPSPPVMGFLSRLCHGKGLDLAVNAFLRLRTVRGLEGLKFRAAGGMTSADRKFIDGLTRQCIKEQAASDFEFLPNLNRDRRLEFLAGLSVMTVPARSGDACAMFIPEALASAIPVVQPDKGAFAELVGETGGGMLYQDGNFNDYLTCLQKVLLEKRVMAELGAKGRNAILEKFDISVTVQLILGILNQLVQSGANENLTHGKAI